MAIPTSATIIDPRYLSDSAGADRAALMAGLRMCADIATADALRGTLGRIARPLGAIGLDDDTLARALETVSHTLYHRSAPAGWASTIIRGHTHAPSVLIGEKAADLITSAHRPRACVSAGETPSISRSLRTLADTGPEPRLRCTMRVMTMNARRRRAHDKLATLPGVRPVRRPVRESVLEGDDEQFDVFYVRTGRKSAHPLVVIPGGPGAASIALYRAFRRRAAVSGLDIIMVEHRGVGLSRHDDAGNDLPPEALSVDAAVDDIAAVLDDAQVDQASVYGTSYGTYLAAGLGVRHPGRIHAMVLDSPLLSADDIDDVRAETRRVLWDGSAPGSSDLASKVRSLVSSGVLTSKDVQMVSDLYGTAGPEVLRRQLDLLMTGHDWLWGAVGLGTRKLLERKTAYHHEPDLVERIAYRELNYGATPDGGPLDPAVALREMATGDVEFVAEPYDLPSAMPAFSWPTAVISGGRDLTTPPQVARRVADLIPDSVFVNLPTAGHSMLDTREHAALEICKAVAAGRIDELPLRSAELDAMPGNLTVRLLVRAVAIAARVESAVPHAVPRVVRQVTPS